MALPTSGPISLGDVNEELGKDSTDTISLNDSDVRSLAGISSGEISLEDLRGKSSVFELTIDSNTTNLNLRSAALNSGWNGDSEAIIEIGSGVIISGNTTGNSTPALLIDGSWPNGITLINRGFILGRGGVGGSGCNADCPGRLNASTSGGSNGGMGGRALRVLVPCSVNNLGTIAGGGGGGGGGGSVARGSTSGSFLRGTTYATASSGAGGGGGRSSSINSVAGSRGNASASSADNTDSTQGQNGSPGTNNSSGSGGNRADEAGFTQNFTRGGSGGNGGNWGASGSNGGNSSNGGTVGLGEGGSRSTRNPTLGGPGGRAIDGNNNINWISTGTRLGSIV